MKLLKELIRNVKITELHGDLNKQIKAINIDSRQIGADNLFIAISGTKVDGHNFITTAINNGATVIVAERIPEKLSNKITYIKVKSSHEALGYIASESCDNPSKQLNLIGITGTNGKTTTATLLYRLFKKSGFKVGLISTVCVIIDDFEEKSIMTTPDAITLNHILKRMVIQGCQYCFMEVSSHAIDQYRIAGLKYKGAIFTNLTHDHLDYHKTFDAYLKTKKSFFDNLPPDAFALTNIDDKNGTVILQNTKAAKYTYSLKTIADYKGQVIECLFDGMLLNIDNQEVWTKFIGKFNAYNLLAVYGCSILLGQPKIEVLKIISLLESVKGRIDTVRSESGITAIIDYAHTPDAIKNVMATVIEIRKGEEQLIVLVGAGGDRDKSKRPEMARLAAENADKVILTSDNPRSENPEDIIADMKKGISKENMKKVLTIPDRREAIKTACFIANKNDIILILGKGHEDYQEIQGVKFHFDDKEIVTFILSGQE